MTTAFLPAGRQLAPLWTAFAIVAVFLALWLLLILAAVPGCLSVGETCADTGDRYGSWLVFHLLDGGWFDVDPRLPGSSYTEMPPGHAFWLTGIFYLFGRESFLAAVVLQAIGIAVTALFARNAVEKVLPGFGNVTLALLLLNPNVIAQAALSQPDPVFMITTNVVFALVLHYLTRPVLGLALALGLVIGISAMIKVPGQYLILLLPLALPLLVALSPGAHSWRKAFLHGLAGAVVAVLVVAPWAYHLWRAGEGITLQDRGILVLVLEDGTKYLGDQPVVVGDPTVTGMRHRAFEREVPIRREAELAARHPGYENFPRSEKNRLRQEWMIDLYLQFPGGVPVFLRALVLSWARVLVPGGEGEYHRLLGIEGQPEAAPATFYGVKFVTLAITVATRLLAVFGLAALVAWRRYDLLVLAFCWIALFTGLTGLVGNTRYRLPSELPLALLAAAGTVYLSSWLRRRPKFA